MILGFNIGNTNTMLGIYEAANASPLYTQVYPSNSNRIHGEIDRALQTVRERYGARETSLSGFAFSSVVPGLNAQYRAIARDRFDLSPFEITSSVGMSIQIMYDDPGELGADRIANAEAAFHDYPGDCIIVDIGTALTFCVLRSDGRFEGGIIAPGTGLCIDALSRGTAQLPRVAFEKPDKIVATSTHGALTAGFYYGWLSLVEGIVRRIADQYQIHFRVILTGGTAALMSGGLAFQHELDPLLTMRGVKYLYDRYAHSIPVNE